MRQQRFDPRTDLNSGLARIGTSNTLRLLLFSGVILGCLVIAVVVRAYNHAIPTSGTIINRTAPQPNLQSAGRFQSDFHVGLAFHPEVDRFRRRLGERFTRPGREQANLVGTLTYGGQQFQARIVRVQGDDGEQVAMNLAGGNLSWSGKDGAKSAGAIATGIERSLIERIALDSPDQFVLAQMRGASYYTIARNVEPAGVSDDYSGPVWDLVRVVEPQHGPSIKPLNEWRIYYINCETGLIDKLQYQDQGQQIVVELSGWAKHAGELEPSVTRWSRDGKIEMELNLSGFSHGSK